MFVADFETYMPDEFNDAPYGKAGDMATADAAGIDNRVVIPGDVPHRVVATGDGCVALDIWSPIREEYISDDVGFFAKD